MRAIFLLQWLAVSGASLIPKQLPLVPISSRIDQHHGILYPNTRNALLDLHRNLIELESITGNEKDVGKWLASYLKAYNFTVELQEVESKRYNVLAYPGSKRETEILITSHIDTVFRDRLKL
jgi:acetylornithine deacetylase